VIPLGLATLIPANPSVKEETRPSLRSFFIFSSEAESKLHRFRFGLENKKPRLRRGLAILSLVIPLGAESSK
jgi:hypothetical protein